MDAITLLKNDHKTVEALFKRFEKAGDKAYAEKRAIVDKIIEELVDPRRHRGAALLPGDPGHRARRPRTSRSRASRSTTS